MPLHVLIESECRWQAGRQAGRQPVRTMCFPNCTGVRSSLLGIQSAPSTTKGAMPSKVQWQCPSRKTEMKTNLGCLSLLLVGWAFHSVSLSICVCQSSIQYLSIYLSSQLLPTTSSLGTVASLLGARREWREAYLIVCPIKLPQFEASMSIATSEERRGWEGRGAGVWFGRGCGEETSLCVASPTCPSGGGVRLSNSTYAWLASIWI